MRTDAKLPHLLRNRLHMLTLATCLVSACGNYPPESHGQPNIILIITDDQGWAQLGSHGNKTLRTPNLDQLATESVELTRFYVSPVCAPTRASLMTGRYNYRTGVVDTYVGRAMMYPDEVTLAESLSEAGYQTGIFGKWHLGDNYPLRTIDQGFHESVVHKGGGIGQPSDPPGNSYFNPILQHNGQAKSYKGYCTNIFFEEALKFIDTNQDRPFFVYLPTNAPHSPFDVPDSYRETYRQMGLDDRDARIYGMITNIDDNVGQLLQGLKRLALEKDTILIFMTDNGATTDHFTGELRGLKGTVYEGGIRVPFLLRWPTRLNPTKSNQIAAHIDVMPTLLEAVGVQAQGTSFFDGISLMPLLEGNITALPKRTLFIQSHRGNEPQLHRHYAALQQQYKLVQPLSFSTRDLPDNETFIDYKIELYNLETDPGETQDISLKHPEMVHRLRQSYETWFDNVSSTRGYDPPRISIGSRHQEKVVLTRQDWRMVGPDGWDDQDLGFWEIQVLTEKTYQIRLLFGPTEKAGTAEIRVQQIKLQQPFEAGTSKVTFDEVPLKFGEAQLEALLISNRNEVGVRYVELSPVVDSSNN